MNDVVNKHQNKPKDIITVPKKEIFIVLNYLGIQKVKLSLNSSNNVFTSSMVILIFRLFSETLAELSLFSPIKTNSAAPLGLKYFIRLAAGMVMITILGKQSVDYMTGKRNILKR